MSQKTIKITNMKLQDVLKLLPGDQVVITAKTREAGGHYARSLIQHLKDNIPYFVDRVDKHSHTEVIKGTKEEKEIVDRANIYVKGFAGLRIDPASFEIVKEK